MTARRNDRKHETLEGLLDLELELSPLVFVRENPKPYQIHPRQLYVMVRLARLATKVEDCLRWEEPIPEGLRQALMEAVDKHWETPVNESGVVRGDWI